MAAVKNDIRDGLWAEGGSPLFQLDGQLRGTSVARIVRRVVSLREIGRIYSSNRPGKKQRMKRMNGTENLKSKIYLIY